MLIDAYKAQDNSFHWLDMKDPTDVEINAVCEKYQISSSEMRKCLDPKHLPAYESFENYQFFLFRTGNEKNKGNASSLRELTQRIGIFVGKNYLITFHKKDQSFLVNLREQWIKELDNYHDNKDDKVKLQSVLLAKIILGVISSFRHAIHQCEMEHEEYEQVLFNDDKTTVTIQEKFLIKRRLYVYKRIFKMTLSILPKIKLLVHKDPHLFSEIHEAAEKNYLEIKQIIENVNNLINLFLSLGSYRTSEILRVLTLYTVFFMPINLICYFFSMSFTAPLGVYGYEIVFVLFTIISVFMYYYFKRKGWI